MEAARFVFRILYPLTCGLIGWAIGATCHAPPLVIETTDRLVVASGEMIRDALKTRERVVDDFRDDSDIDDTIFELLKGDYNNPKKSFGLEPIDLHAL